MLFSKLSREFFDAVRQIGVLSLRQQKNFFILSGNIVHEFEHDLGYLEKGLADGNLVSKEIHDTVWNVEHLNRGGAYNLLHGIFMVFLAYLLIGVCLKYNTQPDARGINLIPHIEFWQEYPANLAEGAGITKDFIMGKLNEKSRGSGGMPSGIAGITSSGAGVMGSISSGISGIASGAGVGGLGGGGIGATSAQRWDPSRDNFSEFNDSL